jgi:hypothetical protein
LRLRLIVSDKAKLISNESKTKPQARTSHGSH